MKSILVAISLFFLGMLSNAQTNNQLDTMIISSINSYIEWGNDSVKQGVGLMDTNSYYICMDGLPANFPLENVQNITFFSLNNLEGLPNSFKSELKKGIKTLFVEINLSINQLVIAVSGRKIKRLKKNNMSIVIRDWGHYSYEYSCEEQKWELKEVRYGGV